MQNEITKRIKSEKVVKSSDVLQKGKRLTCHEALLELEQFCETTGHWPRQRGNQTEAFERYLARKITRREFRNNLNSSSKEKFDGLKSTHGRSISSEELLCWTKDFTAKYKAFPHKNSFDQYENRLADLYSSKKSRKQFSKKQIAEFDEMKRSYGLNKRVSRPEKILLAGLASRYGRASMQANVKFEGYEIDIAIRLQNGRKIGIQYDGKAYHKSPDSAARDTQANCVHARLGFEIIRVREQGCAKLVNSGIEIISTESENESALKKAFYKIVAYIDNEKSAFLLDWEEVKRQAAILTTIRINTFNIVSEYLEYVFLNSAIPPTSGCSNGVKIYRKMKKARFDKKIEGLSLEIIAFTKASIAGYAKLDKVERAALNTIASKLNAMIDENGIFEVS